MDNQQHQSNAWFCKKQWVHARSHNSTYTINDVERKMCDLDQLIAGMRLMLLFYLPMFLAGYAQTTHVLVFWGTWTALLLLLWEVSFLAKMCLQGWQ
jgi:hypothetical protein